MKLFILPMLLSATTALASPIVGTWHCVGSDENIHSDTKVEYLQDGSFRGDAIFKIDDDGNILAYRVVGSGKWRFENNALTESQIKYSEVSRQHSPETLAWLEKSEDGRLLESMMYTGLVAEMDKPGKDDVYQLDKSGKLVSEDGTAREVCTKVK
ncbi:hypothetical protein [Neisseria sp. DTU_2021_1001991_1_SI_NGA_ILE_055]|uniref:hypothetical protein n=1 Tax=Neisseria sp. DTU_2021_1001991_1_SI_NGA_ILE_055 TaxID=3077590 RepID=UPI0028E366C1|nr:hypothetical protein [Neisseria sp. DTU_2021_1001991_1_SI_NGA_ILE_055]WNS83361.1 hypothetical protein RRV97_10340 [Neisseria sp. DTU_2021_1001991_1_SI_NGA_ILE_055]